MSYAIVLVVAPQLAAVLIIPLHKRLEWRNFPWVTLALLLVNVFVFFVLQGRDDRVAEDAASYYRRSGLVATELPLFTAHLRATGRAELADVVDELEEPMRSQWIIEGVQGDRAFRAKLGERLANARTAEELQWRDRRALLDRMWDARFTDKWLMPHERFDPLRVFTAMFLHGDFGHLFGNMLFLVLLGLTVEGALGPALFLGVYLLAGYAGGTLSVLRHFGEYGGGLGASGAIAGLMGAYCLVWGLRKVRFFYWIGPVFDYAKAPALVLLPAWLGWELFNMKFNEDMPVGFDVHAGGIMAGALLAAGVRKLKWERTAFLEEDERRDVEGELRERGMSHLGKLEFPRARAAFGELAALRPDDLTVLVPLYRSWRNEPSSDGFHDAARRVLLHPSGKSADVEQARKMFAEYLEATGNKPRLSAAEILQLARRWTAVGATADAEKLLGVLTQRQPALEGLPEAHFELALACRDRGRKDAADALLRRIIETFPASPIAKKAEFLRQTA